MPNPALPSLPIQANISCYKHYCQFQNLHPETWVFYPRASSWKFRETILSNPDVVQTTLAKKSSFSSLSPSMLHLCPNPLIYHLLPEVVYFALCKCFPEFCAGISLVFTLALPLLCRTLTQGHSEGRLGRGVDGGRDTDLVEEAFSKSPVSISPQQMTHMTPSPKLKMSLRRVWEATSPDSVPDPLYMLLWSMGLVTSLLQAPITSPSPWGTSAPKTGPGNLRLN